MKPQKPTNAVFITATGTGVGKTVVSSLLLGFLRQQGLNAGYQKWVSTGGEMPEDLLYCLKNNHIKIDQLELDSQVVYRFLMPASPHLAAEQEKREVDPTKIQQAFFHYAGQHDLLVVEGVGGILVPLRRDLLLADFVASLKLPVIVVAHSGLGTINHTLLTIEALRSRKIVVLGVIFSDEEQGIAGDDLLIADNMQTIADVAGVEVFGRLPRLGDYARLEKAFKPIGQAVWQKVRSLTVPQQE